jgi:hypothetical protein
LREPTTRRSITPGEDAALAGIDALQFRRDHVRDPRLKDLLERLRIESNWDTRLSPGPQAASVGYKIERARGLCLM